MLHGVRHDTRAWTVYRRQEGSKAPQRKAPRHFQPPLTFVIFVTFHNVDPSARLGLVAFNIFNTFITCHNAGLSAISYRLAAATGSLAVDFSTSRLG